MSYSILDNGFGIYSFNELLEMIKNRYFDGYDETLNYKDKAVWAAEQQRERDFYATYPKFVIFANLYVPLFRICEYGRAMLFVCGEEPERFVELDGFDNLSREDTLVPNPEHESWVAQQPPENLEVVSIVDRSITGIEITKVPSVLLYDFSVNSVAWSRCGQFLTTCVYQNLVLRCSDGSEVFTKSHSNFVRGVCFSHDSRRVLSACEDHVVRVVDVDDGNELMQLRGHSSRAIRELFQRWHSHCNLR